jgi:hypothetical protein
MQVTRRVHPPVTGHLSPVSRLGARTDGKVHGGTVARRHRRDTEAWLAVLAVLAVLAGS